MVVRQGRQCFAWLMMVLATQSPQLLDSEILDLIFRLESNLDQTSNSYQDLTSSDLTRHDKLGSDLDQT
jgi:hypothetical protein